MRARRSYDAVAHARSNASVRFADVRVRRRCRRCGVGVRVCAFNVCSILCSARYAVCRDLISRVYDARGTFPDPAPLWPSGRSSRTTTGRCRYVTDMMGDVLAVSIARILGTIARSDVVGVEERPSTFARSARKLVKGRPRCADRRCMPSLVSSLTSPPPTHTTVFGDSPVQFACASIAV